MGLQERFDAMDLVWTGWPFLSLVEEFQANPSSAIKYCVADLVDCVNLHRKHSNDTSRNADSIVGCCANSVHCVGIPLAGIETERQMKDNFPSYLEPVEEIKYDKTRLRASAYFHSGSCSFDVEETIKDRLRMSMSYQFYQRDAVPPVQYPKDWWEAFKERWFPKWLLKRYPVRYRVVNMKECLMNVPVLATPYVKMYRLERK
jgi:hypothetical protein